MAKKKKSIEKSGALLTVKDALSLLFAVAISITSVFLFSKIDFLREMGYPGIFIISLLSSATVFIPMPGFAVVFAMGGYLNPLLVGIAAGVGSGIGELTGYMAGYAGHDAVARSRIFRQHKSGIEKFGPIAIFALAFLPNPIFDIAGVASGAIRMPAWKFLAATICGKTARYILLAYAGGFASGWI